jgi:hypothetical protein
MIFLFAFLKKVSYLFITETKQQRSGISCLTKTDKQMTNSNDTQTLLDASIVKESAKAYLVNVTVDSHVGLKGWNLWFPKSRSNWDGKKFTVESWLISAKSEDLPEWAWEIMTVSASSQNEEAQEANDEAQDDTFIEALDKFNEATDNEFYDEEFFENGWIEEVQETKQTIENFIESSKNWNESSKPQTGTLNGLNYVYFAKAQPNKGDQRQELSIIDFNSKRICINADVTCF